MILIIDNYDSFTYNLVHLIAADHEVCVRRNDEITLGEIADLQPDGIIISPGPGRPEQAGVSVELVKTLGDRTPILGVCLGHQAVAAAFGAEIVHARELMHGKTSEISNDGEGIFRTLPNPFRATRYHSLVVDPSTLPEELEISATTDSGIVMGIRHRSFPLVGIQFHPESILTDSGSTLTHNWLEQVQRFRHCGSAA